MEIQRIVCNALQENCYIVSDESGECVIIDCGAYYADETEAISRYIEEKGLHPVRLLETHGHLDHNFGNKYIYNKYGLKAEVMTDDLFLAESLPQQATEMFGMTIDSDQPPVGEPLTDGQKIAFGTHSLKVVHTPGHSPGSAVFWCEQEQVAFTGDTLFRMSIGRTDLQGGSWMLMEQSLKRIATALPDQTRILPGHGPESTMADERKYNQYMQY